MVRLNATRVQQLRVALDQGLPAFEECFDRMQPTYDELVALIRQCVPSLVGCVPHKGLVR